MDEFELSPCPFCGSSATVWAYRGGYIVECDNEQCGGSQGYSMTLTFEEVIKLWNTRYGGRCMTEKEANQIAKEIILLLVCATKDTPEYRKEHRNAPLDFNDGIEAAINIVGDYFRGAVPKMPEVDWGMGSATADERKGDV